VNHYFEAAEFFNGSLNQLFACVSVFDVGRHRVNPGTRFMPDTLSCLFNPLLVSTRNYDVTAFLGQTQSACESQTATRCTDERALTLQSKFHD
jgi:hypothetical protein